MYVSAWPGLTLRDVFPSRAAACLPYPLSAERRTSFCVARSGIYHLFRALRLKPQDVVLVPDYYSGNEVAAIRAAGVTVTFYPVLRTLEPDLESLVRLVKRLSPRAIYVIHYLGWPQPLKEIQSLCRAAGSILIEDCALSMLSETEERPLGTFGDYSVFCLYKTLPVPNGGLLVQNNEALPELAGLKLNPYPPLAAASRTAALALESLRSRSSLLGKALSGAKDAAGRILRAASGRHIPVGDMVAETGWNSANVNIAMSAISASVMGGLDYAGIRQRRRRNFSLLRERLRGRVALLREDLPEGVCPLFFPILVQHKHAAAQSFWRKGIGAVEFWSDPQDNSRIGADARYLRRHVLELPIHQTVTESQVEYIADQVLSLNPEPAQC
jgi:dTDP-4-amino-4,6-dideoxygalactose transaminase